MGFSTGSYGIRMATEPSNKRIFFRDDDWRIIPRIQVDSQLVE